MVMIKAAKGDVTFYQFHPPPRPGDSRPTRRPAITLCRFKTRSESAVSEHTGQPILSHQLFPLHTGQGAVIDRQDTEFGIGDFLIELLVVEIQTAEIAIRLDT
jgi:hypothetical protein